jgi:HEPN domain-containing protein
MGASEMTYKHREALVDQIVERQPTLRGFVRESSGDMLAGNWDFVSYSFQRGFESLWDLARTDLSGLIQMPLLSLWRQSVELAIKSTILELAGEISGKAGHNLQALFRQLLDIRAKEGCCDNDDLAQNVQDMIAQVQAFDPFADRFRYPTDRGGKPYAGVAIDVDELFQAHWIITTWCEGAVMEMRENGFT